MVALIGFAMIVAIVFLLLKGKMSPIVVLTLIPAIAALLLGFGLDEFSMSAGSIPAIKNIIRNANYEDLQKMAEECLNVYTTKEVEAIIEKKLAELNA